MTKNQKIVLIVIFIFQVLIASGFELAHDEAYYWIYSKHLDWGYFDHPPFVGVVIKMFSFLPKSELAVRLGFISLQFLGLIILLAMTCFSWVTVLLYFSFPLASFTGLLALPDIPLLFMTICYCFQLKRYLEDDTYKNSSLLGLVISLLFYAKYHGALLVFFTILAIPKILVRKSFYIVTLVALITFLPHMVWQYQHDFSTLRYHFFERPSSGFSWKRSLEFIGLQLLLPGVFVGPMVWWIVIKDKTTDKITRVMKFISIGTVLFFLISSFSKKIEANWTIYLTAPLIFLSYSSKIWQKKVALRMLYLSFGLIILIRIVFVLPANIIGLKRLKEFNGWSQWSQEIEVLCDKQPILANTYQIASKLSFYLNKEVSALNYHSRKNQFDYWRFDKNIPTNLVCYLTDSADFQGQNVLTPEGKNLFVVKNQSMETLLKLKYSQNR